MDNEHCLQSHYILITKVIQKCENTGFRHNYIKHLVKSILDPLEYTGNRQSLLNIFRFYIVKLKNILDNPGL